VKHNVWFQIWYYFEVFLPILVPPALVLIPKHMLASWEKVLAMVTEKDHLCTGAVHRYVLHS